MKLKIHVSKQDIDKGVRFSTHLCPIARAVRRKGFKRVSVSFCISTRNADFDLPSSAINFIERFDDGAKVKPFTFEATQAQLC